MGSIVQELDAQRTEHDVQMMREMIDTFHENVGLLQPYGLYEVKYELSNGETFRIRAKCQPPKEEAE